MTSLGKNSKRYHPKYLVELDSGSKMNVKHDIRYSFISLIIRQNVENRIKSGQEISMFIRFR